MYALMPGFHTFFFKEAFQDVLPETITQKMQMWSRNFLINEDF